MPDKIPALLFAAHLIPRKNLDLLLRALARIKDRPWTLTVAGAHTDPQYTDLCRRLVGQLGLAKRVTFVGYLEPANLEEAYVNHDLLVVPSDYEGFGMVYLEAMIQGCIPIGGDKGGATEVIGDGGFLVPPRKVRPLTLALEKAFAQMHQGQTWGLLKERALKRALQFPTWESTFAPLKVWLDVKGSV